MFKRILNLPIIFTQLLVMLIKAVFMKHPQTADSTSW